MKLLPAILFTTLYGLSVRLLYGAFDGILGIMSLSFLLLVPFVIGYLTVILMPYKKTSTSTGAFFRPWLTCLVLLFVTILLSVEGAICWVMIFPIFATFAGIGGIVAHNRQKRLYDVDDEMDIDKKDWEQQSGLQISLLVLLPLVVGFVEGDRVLTPKVMAISKTITIHASAEKVWQQLVAKDAVQQNKKQVSFASILGFPHHLRTTLNESAVGGKRLAMYEKGLTFQETITAYQPQQKLVLRIDTDPSTISPDVLDEHIVIGGKHVDILEDVYELAATTNGDSRLTLSSTFYINTPFNWYAGVWAHFLMSDILKTELLSIEQRATKK